MANAADVPTGSATSRGPISGSLDELRAINRAVNSSYVQRDDQSVYGVAEWWQRPSAQTGNAGDCEDFALEKRARLIAEGWPADRLRLAVVFGSEIGLHTILVARVEQGDYVLDSRTSRVVRWQRVPYRWLRIQSADDKMRWQRVAVG